MAKKKTARKGSSSKSTSGKIGREPTWDEIGQSIGKKIEKASKEGEFSCRPWELRHKIQCHGSGGFYFLGFIGALVYYFTTAPSFWDAFLGFFKAIFWPAFLVHGVLLFIGA